MRACTTICRQKAKKLVAAVQATGLLSQGLISRKEVQGVVNARAHYSLSPEGILLWEGKPSIPQQRSLINELSTIYQDDPQAGRWGVTKALELPQRKLKWFRMETDVEVYVKTCPTCQGITGQRHARVRKLGAFVAAESPGGRDIHGWDHWITTLLQRRA